MPIPPEIMTAIAWIVVVIVLCVFSLVLAILLGRAFGGIVEDFLKWVR